MKISTHLLFDRGSAQMSSVQTKLTQSQAQMAQGKQIINASDSPNQAATIQRLKSILSRQESYQSSLNTVKARLQGEDTTLQSVSDLLVRAKEVAVQGANDTLSAGDKKTLAAEMQALRDQMLSLANTKDSNGNYLFAGSRNCVCASSVYLAYFFTFNWRSTICCKYSAVTIGIYVYCNN
mgnify:CR=1 FL=1